MIGILCEDDSKEVARIIANHVVEAYNDQVQVQLLSPTEGSVWPVEQAWDDLLIVLYSSTDFPEPGIVFMQKYLQARNDGGFVLPIAISPLHSRPPEPIRHLKAIPYDDRAIGPSGRITQRIGAILGLHLRHRDTRIFISYRAVDGRAIAQQLYDRLESEGFRPWLDEARDAYDGAQNIPGGTDVQKAIEANLHEANLILLVDTPKAPESGWINMEINMANAHLVPILPVCCRAENDGRQGPRFRALWELRRYVPVKFRPDKASDPLEEMELGSIMAAMETYLCELYRRKLRVPYVVSEQFRAAGFTWTPVDLGRYIYESVKHYSVQIRSSVLSHCSIFDEVYKVALRGFVTFIKGSEVGLGANFRLFIYDGEILPEPELQHLYTEENLDSITNLIVLHHQQVLLLLASDFKRVSS
jgi:hypothetical protein